MVTANALLAENIALKAEIEKLKKLNQWYEQQLKLNRQKMFGKSSEHICHDQINFFNEAEAKKQSFVPEPDIEEITYKRKKQKGHREKILSNLPVETIEYTLNNANCPKCGK